MGHESSGPDGDPRRGRRTAFRAIGSRYVESETAPAIRTTSEAWHAPGADRSCPQCGKRADASARFCDAYGARLG